MVVRKGNRWLNITLKIKYEMKDEGVKMEEFNIQRTLEVLGQTVKKDDANKLITFLVMLSAYSEDSQMNLIFNAPSSTGKSYIPLEISPLFPPEDVIEVAHASPKAFFHDHGERSGANEVTVDLERKILIFLDQPDAKLLGYLRPLLSHDRKVLNIKITDKAGKGGLRTKNIRLIGYPAVIFCTAKLRIDEQEATRCILLSPDMNQEKIREAIMEKIKKDSDRMSYENRLNSNTNRKALMDHIRKIRDKRIDKINIAFPKKVESMFFANHPDLKPRHMRDIGCINSIIKSLAINKYHSRVDCSGTIVANEADINEAFDIWKDVSKSMELSLPPYIYDMFEEIVNPLYSEKGMGISRKDIMMKHMKVYKRPLPDWKLRQEILPMLESAGLIYQEPDINDKRNYLVYVMKDKVSRVGSNNSEHSNIEFG